jgi:hypothetical protein
MLCQDGMVEMPGKFFVKSAGYRRIGNRLQPLPARQKLPDCSPGTAGMGMGSCNGIADDAG